MTSSQAHFDHEGKIIPPHHPPGIMISLPGQGTPGPDCGHDVPMHCYHCGHAWVGRSSCMLRSCPNCWRKWAHGESRAAGLRMWAGCSMIAPKRTGRRIVHAVISFIPLASLAESRKYAIKMLKHHGLSGGMLIFHPFRQDEEKEYVFQSHIHFHVIALARGAIFPGSAGTYFFKVIQDAKNKDFRGFQDVCGIKACVFYLLTHCGIVEGRHALTWWGELSYNMLSNEKLFDAIPELKRQMDYRPGRRCPACGSDDVSPDYITDWTDGSLVDCRPGAFG